jgi:hypothetical protein
MFPELPARAAAHVHGDEDAEFHEDEGSTIDAGAEGFS